tara:strand:+ start:25 stop:315 length:291 start_codon:yes stop_codon:yes gene_type:complete
MTVKKKIEAQHKKKPVVEITKATVQVKDKKVDVYTKAYNDTIKRAGSVYSANFKTIDETIEDIKKMSRKVSTSDYSANNVYLLLQDCLKKITLAEK